MAVSKTLTHSATTLTTASSWEAVADQAGTYNFATAGQYVDEDITLKIPSTTQNFSGGGLTDKTASLVNGSGLSFSTSDSSSGAYIQPQGKAGVAAVTYTASGGWLDKASSATSVIDAKAAASWNGSTSYLTALSIKSGKTFGTASSAGLSIDGTVYASTKTSGTLNVNGGAADKGVQIIGRVTKVDNTTVTDSSGDLITTTLSSTGGSVSGSNVTLSDTNNGISVTGSGSGTVASDGWITAGTAESSSQTKYISGVVVPTLQTFNVVNNATVNITANAGSVIYLTDSVTGKTWTIEVDSANNALSISQP